MPAPIIEDDAGPRHQILDRARDEDLPCIGQRDDACADVDGETLDPRRGQLDLAGVQPRPDLDPEDADRVADRGRTADRTRGAVERRKEAVADDPYLLAAMPVELLPNDAMVVGEKRYPTLVAEFRGALGRPDDVGEQHRR